MENEVEYLTKPNEKYIKEFRKKNTQLTVSLRNEDYEKIKKYCNKRGLKVGTHIRTLILQYINDMNL